MEWSRQRSIIVVVVAVAVILAPASAYLVLTAEDRDPNAHDPIRISTDADFTQANGVSAGDGTPSNPYVIEGWNINQDLSENGIALFRTDAHVLIRNMKISLQDKSNQYLNPTGILLSEVSNCTIHNVTFVGKMLGIDIAPTYASRLKENNLSVTYNTFMDCMGGVSVRTYEEYHLLTMSLEISNNTFDGGNYCVFARKASNIIFNHNNIRNCSIGSLALSDCRDCSITNNTFTREGELTIRIRDSSRIVVSDNSRIFGWTGILISGSDNVTVQRNNVSSVGVGVVVSDSQDVVVGHIDLHAWEMPEEHLAGIWLESSKRVEASHNTINSYRIGILVVQCEDCTWVDNRYLSVGTEVLIDTT
jgi:parallel beta-helix repeat protein